MTPEEQAAAEAAAAANQQTPEEIAAAEAAAAEAARAAAQPVFYTAEELDALHVKDIDPEKVAPEARPAVEKAVKEYKSLLVDHTKKSMELADLKRVPDPVTYFEDSKKDTVFRDYLKTPHKVISDINAEIANLEAVIPGDGTEEYRKARRTIAYWNGIKDEFQEKRIELSEQARTSEIADAKLKAELGADATTLLDYAITLGFNEKEFKANPRVREAVKKTYTVEHAGVTAVKKEVKPLPHKAATPSGAGAEADKPVDTSKMTDAQWFAYDQKLRIEKIRKKLGG